MKNRLLCIAMVAVLAFGMISCGNPAGPEEFILTTDNVDNYIKQISSTDDLKVNVEETEFTDELVASYADYYYNKLATEGSYGLISETGAIAPLTDDSIKEMNSEIYSDVNEYMVFVRKTVREYIKEKYKRELCEACISEIVANSEFNDIPAGLIEKEKIKLSEFYKPIADSYDIELEKYFEYADISLDELSLEAAKSDIAVLKLAKDELNCEAVSEEEIEEAVFDFLFNKYNQ